MPTKKVTTPSATTQKTTAAKRTASAKKSAEAATATTPSADLVAEKKAAVAKEAAAIGVAGDKSTAKSASKASAAKRSSQQKDVGSVTTIIAKVDIGYGNHLYLRGEGAGLSWTKGVLMENTAGDEWLWSTPEATEPLTFKFLINDEVWSAGDNLTVIAGDTSTSTPVF